MTPQDAIAHIDPKNINRRETVDDHNLDVGELAAELASFVRKDLVEPARIAGSVHDIGKYGPIQNDIRQNHGIPALNNEVYDKKCRVTPKQAHLICGVEPRGTTLKLRPYVSRGVELLEF